MRVPKGWKLVPIVMTPEMRRASLRALERYKATLSIETHMQARGHKCGPKVGPNLKHELRYRAAIDAAPPPPENDDD